MGYRIKEYNQNQNWLFPPSIEELIPENHPVRIVNSVIEQINITPLLKTYSKEGHPSYHPRMMLKVMVYAYMDNIYSSRKIEKALNENINFMWLSGRQTVDHNTIARFRSNKLKEVFKDIFKQVVLLLAEEGLVNLKRVYTDGTKIESVAGRYTFVWGNAIKTNKEKMVKNLEEMWQYAQSIADEEDKDPEPPNFKELDPDKVEKVTDKINQILKEKSKDNKKKTKSRYIKKNYPANLRKYQQQEETLNGRSSYSKTDTDATFMRMKDDHMRNGQLKPGYNAQISTENQIIVNYTIHQDTNDIHTLKPHLENYKQLYGTYPSELTADAGYGSEENYKLLDDKGITGFVKFNTFDKEQGTTKGKKSKRPFERDNLYYNTEGDFYVCPTGQRMEKSSESRTKTKSGYEQIHSRYTAKNCKGCSIRSLCFKGKGNRSVERNHSLEHYKHKARELLTSETGQIRRKQRTADVEPTFAQLKHNRNFKRFTLKGKEKVEIEFGLHALAHNIKKMIA